MLTAVACLAVVLFRPAQGSLHAQAADALTGLVTSSDEGPMEGVLVSATRAGSMLTTTVVSDGQGRYRFPRARLEPGQYALRIRAIGYDLESAATASVVAQKPTTADLKLRKAHDVASQLTNAEWLASFPGTDEQKASVRGCAHCHTLERVMRSRHDVEAFVSVIERMAGYPPLAFPLMPQRTPAPRIGARSGPGRATATGAAASGGIPGQPQPELRSAVELRLQDAAAAEGQRDAGHLHGVRLVAENEAAA